MRTSCFRFYEELNDFLPKGQRKKSLEYSFKGSPGIKDPIEAQGVPHTEVDLIIVNGESVDFNYQLKDGNRVAVYPVFESFDITPITRLGGRPLRKTAFVLDVHLGKLARKLRMLGFDARYANNYADTDLVKISVAQRRILLTRDRRLLFHKVITHGYWVRSTEANLQVAEVVHRFDLYRAVRPFRRCMDCNGLIEPVDKEEVWDQLQPLTKQYYDEFYRCRSCSKVYWPGSHVERMNRRLHLLAQAATFRRSSRPEEG